MKNRCLLPVICCLLALIISCKQKSDFSAEISRLDSALASVKNSDSILRLVDTAGVRRIIALTDEKLSGVSAQLRADTLRKSSAIFLSDCYETLRHLQGGLENRKYHLKALGESKVHLEALAHDLKENLLDKNKASEYVVTELKECGKLTSSALDIPKKMNASAAILDTLQSRIAAFADSIQLK